LFDSNQQLKEYIIFRSGYIEDDGPSFTNACRLRRFVSRSIPATYDERCLVDVFLSSPCSKELYLLFNYLKNGKGGFFCGGTADTLTRVYRLFDFKAVSLNIGCQSIGLTHMLTLVEVLHSGLNMLTPQDAYFNNTILSSETLKPLDYHKIYELLKSSRVARLIFSRFNTKKVFLTPSRGGLENIDRSIATFYWDDPNWKNWLRSKVSSDNMIYALMFPFEVYEDTQSASIKDFIHSSYIGRT